MFSIRKEGEAFKSGLNFQIGGGSKHPYFSVHLVNVNFNNTTVIRYSIRFRLRHWPMVLLNKVHYNYINEWLKIRDLTIVTKEFREDWEDHEKWNDHKYQMRLKRVQKYAETCTPEPKRTKFNRFPDWLCE